MNITKEKNLLMLSVEEGKVYTLNLTTGEWIGLRGVSLKHTPRSIVDTILLDRPRDLTTDYVNVIACIQKAIRQWGRGANSVLQMNLPLLSLCERLDALHLEIGIDTSYLVIDWEDCPLKYVADHFADYCTYRQTHPGSRDCRDFYLYHDKQTWLQENKIPVEHLSEDFICWLYRKAGETNYDGTRRMEGDKLRWFLYHAKTLYEFAEAAENYRDRATQWFNRYWEELTTIGAKPEKGNFMKLYIDVHKTYLARKKEIEERALREFQLEQQSALNFSANGLTVIIPVTKEEFAQEAAQQHNCVESIYLSEVCHKATHVVFIRKDDDPTKSYITCEVSNYGRIRQFYLHYNQNVYEESDREFRALYQAHLDAHWNDAPTPTAE